MSQLPSPVSFSDSAPRANGGRDNFSQDLRAANDKAHLAWSCLDFHHTFGSHLAMTWEGLYKISKLMGNSPEICRRRHAALIPESLGDSMEFTRTADPTVQLFAG